MKSVMIFSGVEWATSSMSMPPSLEAMKATFCVARSVTSDDVVFLLDVGAFLDVQAAHLLAFGAGLVRLQLHAEDLAGQLLQVVHRARELDAAALAAAAGVDLGLDDPDAAAEFLSGFHRLLHRERGVAARHGHAELAQEFLALVFVDLHGSVFLKWSTKGSVRGAAGRVRSARQMSARRDDRGQRTGFTQAGDFAMDCYSRGDIRRARMLGNPV